MSGLQYMTKETLETMKAELQHMRGVERPAAARAIAEAREKGDLKENAEYDAAKDAQGHLEAKIAQLEDLPRALLHRLGLDQRGRRGFMADDLAAPPAGVRRAVRVAGEADDGPRLQVVQHQVNGLGVLPVAHAHPR